MKLKENAIPSGEEEMKIECFLVSLKFLALRNGETDLGLEKRRN